MLLIQTLLNKKEVAKANIPKQTNYHFLVPHLVQTFFHLFGRLSNLESMNILWIVQIFGMVSSKFQNMTYSTFITTSIPLLNGLFHVIRSQSSQRSGLAWPLHTFKESLHSHWITAWTKEVFSLLIITEIEEKQINEPFKFIHIIF